MRFCDASLDQDARPARYGQLTGHAQGLVEGRRVGEVPELGGTGGVGYGGEERRFHGGPTRDTTAFTGHAPSRPGVFSTRRAGSACAGAGASAVLMAAS